MAYYMRGDYSTGGYYRGDPGLFSFAKRLVKKVPRAIGGFTAGGILGGAGALLTKGAGAANIVAAGPAAAAGGRALSKQLLRKLKKYGPAIGGGMLGGELLDMFGKEKCCPPGYHFAKDGSGECVRNRRMNVCNPKALRRSIRRLQGFEKLAKRTLKSTQRVRVRRKAA